MKSQALSYATEKMLPAIRAGQVENPVSLESVINTAMDLLLEKTPTQDARIGYYPGRGIVRAYLSSDPDKFYNPAVESEKLIDEKFDPKKDIS